MVETKPQRKRRAPVKKDEATQAVVSPIQEPETPTALPHSSRSQERIKRLPNGLVIVHQ